MKSWIPALTLCVFTSGCASGLGDQYPAQTDDGLTRVESKAVDALYWKDGATLANFQRVRIEDCDVEFRAHWLRDQNMNRMGVSDRVSTEDMEEIREAVSELFTEQFTKELGAGGYSVVDVNAPDVLLLRPSIVDLDVNAPDMSMRQAANVRTYTASAGEMTLHMDLVDSATNELIGRVIDHREDSPYSGDIRYTNSITNAADARRMIGQWARQLREGLDNAHESR